MSQNTLIVPHKRRHIVLYNLCASNLALRATHFKFHDWLKHRSIGFQSTTPETTQNDRRFCAYRRSVALDLITGAARSTQETDTRTHTWPTHQRDSKSKGLPIDVPLCFYYFHTRIAVYKKWGGSRSTLHTSSTVFHTRLLSRIKVKGLHRYVLSI
jgi:hypothetical protein